MIVGEGISGLTSPITFAVERAVAAGDWKTRGLMI